MYFDCFYRDDNDDVLFLEENGNCQIKINFTVIVVAHIGSSVVGCGDAW